jgi:predicted cupin superfamily sugar epimerase
MIRDEIKHNTETALTEYMEKSGLTGTAKEDYKKMISIILSGLTDTEATDGQSYSSPSSIRKKLALQGEWDEEKEKAYQAISKGDFNINHLGIMLQPSKPFVTSDMAKYSGSTTMELRKTPLQDKNSEYLILLADALVRGAGMRSKFTAIYDFMEETHKDSKGNYHNHGIDTIHFSSVAKVGLTVGQETGSPAIDLAQFDKDYDSIYDKNVEDGTYIPDRNLSDRENRDFALFGELKSAGFEFAHLVALRASPLREDDKCESLLQQVGDLLERLHSLTGIAALKEY